MSFIGDLLCAIRGLPDSNLAKGISGKLMPLVVRLCFRPDPLGIVRISGGFSDLGTVGTPQAISIAGETVREVVVRGIFLAIGEALPTTSA